MWYTQRFSGVGGGGVCMCMLIRNEDRVVSNREEPNKVEVNGLEYVDNSDE